MGTNSTPIKSKHTSGHSSGGNSRHSGASSNGGANGEDQHQRSRSRLRSVKDSPSQHRLQTAPAATGAGSGIKRRSMDAPPSTSSSSSSGNGNSDDLTSQLRRLRKRTHVEHNQRSERKSTDTATAATADSNSNSSSDGPAHKKPSIDSSSSSSMTSSAAASPPVPSGGGGASRSSSPKPDDLISPATDKRPPVKLMVKFKEGRKPCQVRVVNTSLTAAIPSSSANTSTATTITPAIKPDDSSARRDKSSEAASPRRVASATSTPVAAATSQQASSKNPSCSINLNSKNIKGDSPKKSAVSSSSKQELGSAMTTTKTEPHDDDDSNKERSKVASSKKIVSPEIKVEVDEVNDEKDVISKVKKETVPLSTRLSSEELVKAIEERLGHNDGDISTSLMSEDSAEIKNNTLEPPKIPKVVLTKEELSPPTPCVFVKTKAEAFSPQLFELCLQRPIVVIRNLAPVCGIDMSLYGTKTLVETHPNHPVEIRSQMEQSADENWDASFEKKVWYCTSSRSHTTISKYAEYQAAGLEDAYQEALDEAGGKAEDIDFAKLVNPPEKPYNGENVRKMLKFGTNCDLSDNHKWGPQLSELDKLPAWARVVSAGNMLSHLGHQILGMNTVQLYMKVPRARTPGHQENNNFCAVNLNVGPGDSEWFGVPNDYWGGLQNICKKNKLDFLHGSWWPFMGELHEAGIPVYRFMQKPGDLVWVNTGCVHWVQAAGWCNNIAWNVGPLTAHQFKVAIERYEWNKTQKYQSIVAMEFLSWNLARNICLSNVQLWERIRHSLMHSLRRIVQTLNFVRSRGVKVKFHGRRSHESAHYCGVCDEEVFNVLLIKESEKRHVVHCLRCARQPNAGGKDLKGIIALVEYPLKELLYTYDNFKLVSGVAAAIDSTTTKSEDPAVVQERSRSKSTATAAVKPAVTAGSSGAHA